MRTGHSAMSSVPQNVGSPCLLVPKVTEHVHRSSSKDPRSRSCSFNSVVLLWRGRRLRRRPLSPWPPRSPEAPSQQRESALYNRAFGWRQCAAGRSCPGRVSIVLHFAPAWHSRQKWSGSLPMVGTESYLLQVNFFLNPPPSAGQPK